MYDKREGKLDVYIRGKSRTKWDVAAIFAQTVLRQKRLDPLPRGRTSYALERFKRRGRHFSIDPQSGISSASVSLIRLTPRLGPKRHVILQAQAAGKSEPIYDLLSTELASLEVDEFDVTQFMIKVVFARTAHQRKRTIPLVLTAPNRCSIGYDAQELTVRRMLVDSDIEPRDPSDREETAV